MGVLNSRKDRVPGLIHSNNIKLLISRHVQKIGDFKLNILTVKFDIYLIDESRAYLDSE